MMRVLLPFLVLASIALTSCGRTDHQPAQEGPVVQPKKCPDVNNRDRNDPCSPLYFKKNGSKLPDRNSF
jgi:hypothetical protein